MSVNFHAYVVYGFKASYVEQSETVLRYNEVSGNPYEKTIVNKAYVCDETNEILNVTQDDLFGTFDLIGGTPIGNYDSGDVLIGIKLYSVDEYDMVRTIIPQPLKEIKFREWVMDNMTKFPELKSHLVMYCS